MLRIKFAQDEVVVVDVADNTLNVADVDLFAKAVNTILAYTKLCQLSIKPEEDLTNKEDSIFRQVKDLFKDGYILACEDRDKDHEKVYKIPVFKQVKDIPADIIRQAYYYCIACNNGNVATNIVTVNGKDRLSRAYVRHYLDFWSLCIDYHQKGEPDSILDDAVSFVRDLGSEFNSEAGGLLRKFDYSVSKSNVKKAMNIAVEVLGMGNDGNINARTVKGKNAASVQLACLLFHFKPTKTKVKVRTQVEL